MALQIGQIFCHKETLYIVVESSDTKELNGFIQYDFLEFVPEEKYSSDWVLAVNLRNGKISYFGAALENIELKNFKIC